MCLHEVKDDCQWDEVIEEVFDNDDVLRELVDNLKPLSLCPTTQEDPYFTSLEAQFEAEEDAYDAGEKDGEIRLARRLLKTMGIGWV
jgi:hypothetical protein